MPVTGFIPLEELKSVKKEDVGQTPVGHPVPRPQHAGAGFQRNTLDAH